jgi:hypothetical protein
MALRRLFDRVCLTIGAADEALEPLDVTVAALTAANRAQQQDTCKSKTRHPTLLYGYPTS